MVTVIRGDVILCDLNPVIGTEQAGVRPALVVQIDRANTVSPHTIIAPFTTRIRRAVLPSHALIPAGIGGVTHDSVVLCEQIRVIDKRRILRISDAQPGQTLAVSLKCMTSSRARCWPGATGYCVCGRCRRTRCSLSRR